MKTKLLGSALFATLLLGANLAYAAGPSPLTTSGLVTVEEGSLNPTDPTDPTKPIDPEKPGENIPTNPDTNIKPNPEADGPLEITHAADIKFETVKNSATEITKNAKPIEFTDSSGDQKRGAAYVQFGDIRTTANGYTVYANMTKQFTQGTTKLDGATITLNNPYAATTKDNTVGQKPTLNTGVILAEGAGAQEIAVASNSTNAGKGIWALEYGSSKAVSDTDTTENSVQLKIPASTAMTMPSGDYQATIEWSIAATPSS